MSVEEAHGGYHGGHGDGVGGRHNGSHPDGAVGQNLKVLSLPIKVDNKFKSSTILLGDINVSRKYYRKYLILTSLTVHQNRAEHVGWYRTGNKTKVDLLDLFSAYGQLHHGLL